jgi:hypothetical protein
VTRGVASAGYSGTPLHRKLGLSPGHRVLAVSAPEDLGTLLAGAPADLEWLRRPAAFDVALVFVRDRKALVREFPRLAKKQADAAAIWIAWPKQASGVATDLSENVVREIGLGIGLVDVKVCAIDATWSGLKFVRRLRDRAPPAKS